jgi:hypothetical protein
LVSGHLSQKKFVIAIDGPAASGKSTVARRVAAELIWLYADSGSLYRAVTRRALQRGIDPRVHEVQQQIKGLFEKTFGSFDFIQIPLKNGGIRNYTPQVYYKMVARSEMRIAQTQAVRDRCKEYDNTLVQVSRHDNPCDLCVEIEDMVYSLVPGDPDYPELGDFPPHPNCEHNLNPTSRVALRLGI